MSHVQPGNTHKHPLAVRITASLIIFGYLLLQWSVADGGTGNAPALTCDDVTLSRSSGRPTNLVNLSGIPAGFTGVPALRVTDTRSAATVVIPADGTAGSRGGMFVVPVHPNHTAAGGRVTLTLFDGQGASCNPMAFTIEPLPAAPGAFAELVELLGQAFDETERLFGAAGAGAEGLDQPAPLPTDLPLSIVEDWLRGSDNENSPERIAAGEAPLTRDAPPEVERIIDGIVQESGILPELGQYVDDLQQTPGPPAAEPSAETAPPADKPAFCHGPWYEPDAALLSWMMSQGRFSEQVQQKAGPYLTAVGTLSTVVGILSLVPTAGIPNPVTAYAGGVVATISAADLLMETSKRLLPSLLIDLTFDYGNALYAEDAADLDGYWENVMLTARSEGMSVDGIILNSLLKRATGGLSRKFLGEHAGNQVITATSDFLTGSFSKGTSKRLTTPGPDGLVNLPACDFGPTDISDLQYHHAEFMPADGPARVTPDRTFIIVDTGQAELVIRPYSGIFGHQEISAAKPVEARPIELTITPDRVNGDPGYVAAFTVTLNNAEDTSVNLSLDPAGSHLLHSEQIGTNVYQVTITTSPDGTDFPAVLLAESASTTGLRMAVSSPPRIATASLRSTAGAVEVAPFAACVEPGDTEVFTAVVAGFDNPDVIWQASAGTMASGGMFTAPQETGQHTITAVSVADPTMAGNAAVTVAEDCSCWSTVSYAGINLPADSSTLAFGKMGDGTPRLIGLSFYHDLRTGHRWYIAGLGGGSASYSAEILSRSVTSDYWAFKNIGIPYSATAYPYPWGSTAEGHYFTPNYDDGLGLPEYCYATSEATMACFDLSVIRPSLHVDVTIDDFGVAEDGTEAWVKGSLTGKVNAQFVRPQESWQTNALGNPWQEVGIRARFQGTYDTQAFPNPTEALDDLGMAYRALEHTRLYCQERP